MASEAILTKKKEEVKNLAEKIKEAKLVLLTDYRGINVEDVTNLRADLRKSSTEYTVIKNNITRRALKEAGIEGLEEQLVGPTAVILNSEDYLEAAKTIYNFSKENDYYKIKGGVVDGKVMTAEEIITLAKLPSKETLLSMLAGGLLATISKFAVALEQVRIKKESEPDAVAEEPAKAEEVTKTEEPKAEAKEETVAEEKTEEVKEAEEKEEKSEAETEA